LEIDPEDKSTALRYDVCGIVTGVQEKRGKQSGKSFGIVTVEYGRHSIEFIVFNSAWRSHKFLFRIRTPGVFTIKQTAPNEYGESYAFSRGYILKP
jgi:DNA polymerase III alpha subunit